MAFWWPLLVLAFAYAICRFLFMLIPPNVPSIDVDLSDGHSLSLSLSLTVCVCFFFFFECEIFGDFEIFGNFENGSAGRWESDSG